MGNARANTNTSNSNSTTNNTLLSNTNIHGTNINNNNTTTSTNSLNSANASILDSNDRDNTNNNITTNLNSMSGTTNNSSNRKNSYRIRDQRWYDSYRDELYNSSTGLHSHSQKSASNILNANSDIATSSNLNAANIESIKKVSDDDKKFKQLSNFTFGESLQYWNDKVKFFCH